ncbi:restriction endonuclease subunit S [Leuconostoc mesenteroides]|nr:restriction endonuclease subunit S [Leuconostoc mesenteroides]
MGEVGSLNRGKSKHRPRNDSRLYGGKYPFIQTGDVAKAGLLLEKHNQTYSEFGIEQSKLWSKGTLVITIAANIAGTSILNINAAFPDSIIGFESQNTDMIFIKNAIDHLSNKLKSKAETSSQANLNLAKLSELKIVIPNFEEQTSIGVFFNKLENLIAQNEHKLDLLKQLKQAYLQKIFSQELRFAGFSGTWEQRKLGKIGNTFNGLTGKTKEDFGHGDAKFVTYLNVFQNELATLKQLDSVEIDEQQNQVQKGDVFFTTSSETPEEVGMSSVWTYDIKNIYLNSFTFGYRPTVELDLEYLATMLRSPSVRKKITFLAQGISRYNISKSKMMKIEVPIPNIFEQENIGSLFKQLDNLITLNQKKLNLLKKQKQAYLQKMFI